MAATSFNGVTATIDTQAVLITSIDFSGGDTALVDVTASASAYRQNIAGIRAPFTVTLNGHSESGYHDFDRHRQRTIGWDVRRNCHGGKCHRFARPGG